MGPRKKAQTLQSGPVNPPFEEVEETTRAEIQSACDFRSAISLTVRAAAQHGYVVKIRHFHRFFLHIFVLARQNPFLLKDQRLWNAQLVGPETPR